MGVKDLWIMVSPLGERKPLHALEGKTIAIDLSIWIVESKNLSSHPKMHLRNLFFRTLFFLKHNITPVFVLDGTAPALKYNTIAKRNNNHSGSVLKNGERTQFNAVVAECKELLRFMGINCIQSEGEAEALCSYLNEDGLVDGCISEDSDCFLYGAKVVYRNFTMGKKKSDASIDEYSFEKIQTVLNLGRNKMIALALICGCDYDKGLFKVGKEAALKFFKTVKENEVLERIKQWKTSSELKRMERKLSDPYLCRNCGHTGDIKIHKRTGCTDCETVKYCNDTYKEKRALMVNEIMLRKKALENDNFPNQKLIDEFLVRKGSVPSKLDLKWKMPNIIQFIDFMERTVQWKPGQSFCKMLPLVIQWQLLNLSALSDEERQNKECFSPVKIQKAKIRQGVPMFEILWQDKYDILERVNIFEDTENDNKILSENGLITTERQDLFTTCYPDITKVYEESIEKNLKQVKEINKKMTKDNALKRKRKQDEVKSKKITDFFYVKRKKGPQIDLNKLEEVNQVLKTAEISPEQPETEYDSGTEVEFSDKKNPDIVKTTSIGSLNKIVLNESVEKILNELTPDDFLSEREFSDDES